MVFPEQFSINSLLYLIRIVKFGSIAGINSFIFIDEIEESQ